MFLPLRCATMPVFLSRTSLKKLDSCYFWGSLVSVSICLSHFIALFAKNQLVSGLFHRTSVPFTPICRTVPQNLQMLLSFCPVPPRVLSKYDNTIRSLCYSTLQPESTQYVSTGYVSGEWCHSCKLRLSNLFEVLGSATNAMNHIPFISQTG